MSARTRHHKAWTCYSVHNTLNGTYKVFTSAGGGFARVLEHLSNLARTGGVPINNFAIYVHGSFATETEAKACKYSLIKELDRLGYETSANRCRQALATGPSDPTFAQNKLADAGLGKLGATTGTVSGANVGTRRGDASNPYPDADGYCGIE